MGFDSVDELNSLDAVGEVLGAVEQPPSLGGGLHEFEDHRQAGGAAATAVGPPVSQSHRSERALNQIQSGLREQSTDLFRCGTPTASSFTRTLGN